MPTSESPYSYRIRAHNKADWGEWSDKSAPRRGVVAPGAPTSLAAAPHDRYIDVTYNPGSRNGATVNEISYQYTLNGGGSWQTLQGNRIGGLTNGTTYNIRVRAVASVDGGTYAGAASNNASAVPYGPPSAPGAGAQNLGTQVKLTWNSNGSGNGRAIQLTQIDTGNGWQDVAASGERIVGNGYQQDHSIRVRAQDSAGQWTPVATAAARTSDPPQPTATTVKGTPGRWPAGWGGDGACTHSSCAYMAITVTNFPAGNYVLRCNDNNQFGGRSIYVPANGTVNLSCFYGVPGNRVFVTIEGWGNAEPMTWY